MTAGAPLPDAPPRSPVDLAVRLLVLAALVAIPLRIVALGFLPPDDALRHAAKAVSGRPWSEILVLRPDMALDVNAGWHAFLGVVRFLSGADAHALVLVSVIGLFVLAWLPPVLMLRRPEAALASLLILAIADQRALSRLVSGRPLLVSMAVLSTVALSWPRLRDGWGGRVAAVVSLAFAVATLAHGSWFLFLLPLCCFFLVGEQAAARRLTALWALGVVLGVGLTGHPIALPIQALRHAWLSLGSGEPVPALTLEFQPAQGSPFMVLAVVVLLLLRGQAGQPRARLADPVLAIAVVGWVLGFTTRRFWTDWGAPAATVWIALELEHALVSRVSRDGWLRLAHAGALATAVVLAVSNDYDGRWSRWAQPALRREDPRQAPWLPEAGGVLYTPDMAIFFRTFYRNPSAPWRYVLGYEPALMLPDDLAVYRAYARGVVDPQPLEAWALKMRPVDRLLVPRPPPELTGLEWRQLLPGVWSGRLRQVQPTSSPPS